MSIFRMPTLSSISTRFEGLRGRLGRGSQLGAKHQKTRHLALDPLEQRQLLSVSPADWTDTLVNQTVSEDQVVFVGFNQYGANQWDVPQSMAMDDDGDFVVTWTRYDQVRDAQGNPVIDPKTGQVMRDANIYARYFTDEVQRISIPEELTVNNVDGQYGFFTVKYGGNEIQKLTISATHEPYWSGGWNQNDIVGGITLGFDVNGSGNIGPGETATIFYNERNTLASTASQLQTALQGLGGALADATVKPVSPGEFEIHFGNFSLGEDQPMITVVGTSFTGGFLPAVQVEALREPVVLGPIYVSPDNPNLTATSIEEAFRMTTTRIDIAPIRFQPAARLGTEAYNLGPYAQPVQTRQGVPTVNVTPVEKYVPLLDNQGQPVLDGEGNVLGTWVPSLTDFEIVFNGASGSVEGAAGKKDHPELVFVAATNDAGTPVANLAAKTQVRTIKEPSPEFRVNPEEPENPFTPLPDKFAQTDSAVAMDADGNFVIVWTSEVPNWQNPGSISDIYARQFTPIGNQAPAEVQFVPGIMANGDAFRVNTSTPGMQGDPSVGMDDAGNFTIAWGSGAQDLSYFNSVRARNFDRDYYKDPANPSMSGREYLVNTEDTAIHFNPYVAVSPRGDVLITWVRTDDENYITNNGALASSVRAVVFDRNENVIMPQFAPGGAGRPRAAFDKTQQSNFVITWDSGNNDADSSGVNSLGSRAQRYRLYNQNSVLSPIAVGPTFAVNSADTNTARTALWPLTQGLAQPALDADGDLTILFEGVGPDVQEQRISLDYSYFQAAFNDPANADLLGFLPSSLFGSGEGQDVDHVIEMAMIAAANNGASMQQLGRIRAILDAKAGLLRGDAYGIMYSQFDADISSSSGILFSDSIANAQRDGHNQKWLLVLDTNATSGNVTLRLWSALRSGFEDVQVTVAYTNQRINVGNTRTAIENALRGAARTGTNWPEPVAGYEGPVSVRTVSNGFGNVSAEIMNRQVALSDGSRPWAYPWDPAVLADRVVYEITFQGEVHDLWVDLAMQDNNLQPQGSVAQVAEYQAADSGIVQRYGTIEMEPDGDFTMVWLQHEEYTSDSDNGNLARGSANQNIYYRRFDESTDTAGPRITDLIDHNGNRVDSGATIEGAVRHIVIAFDEPLMSDSDANPFSVLNPDNWTLSQDGIPIVGAVQNIRFGMNKAAELAGTYDGVGDANGGLGERYDLSRIPSNRWEAVLTLDANGAINAGMPRLGIGAFEITAASTIHDAKGNPLQSLGTTPTGLNVTKTFEVSVDLPDIEVDSSAGSSNLTSATLHPETPNAVAVDADGDHVVVWTAYDSTAGHDRLYMRLFRADGTPGQVMRVNSLGQPLGLIDSPVIPVTGNAQFLGDVQRYGSVAIDPDGDFVVTWTNYRNGQAEIFARRFDARPSVTIDPITQNWNVVGDAAFQVNDYTRGVQKWSDVAMDREGNFVVTWTSYAQELNGNIGTGYGVYARRYDSEGQALAREFQVNVTTAGDQQTPSIAMAANGEFVIAWTSDQNGTDDDIIVREFNADGSPKAGPLSGERRVNDYAQGHQRYPDVAMRFDGQSYVVTWTDTAADISGTSVWAELSAPQPKRYMDPISHAIFATHSFTINVGDSFTIADVNVQLGELIHARLQDLRFELTHGNVTITLFDNLPRPFINGTLPPNSGRVMLGPVLDDQAPSYIRITESDRGAYPVYTGTYVPQDALSQFNGMNAAGVWTLTVTDINPGNGLSGGLYAISETIGSWNLDITPTVDETPESFLVNSTTKGHQMFPSVAMDTYGNFTVTWSGQGEADQDTSGHGVYYQRYDRGGTRIGRQTLVNLDTAGDQWISSVGMDARGNFVIAWTGQGTLPGSSAIYKYDSIRNFPRTDNDGPIVTDVYYGTERIFNGGVIVTGAGAVTQMTVVFNEDLSVLGGTAGLNSVLNPNNWSILRNDQEIVGGIAQVLSFGLNPLTNKYEATVKFDGNGVGWGTPGLDVGEYVLTVRDLITDTSRFIDPDDTGTITPGNYLDGDFDGVPGSQPITIGLGGYEHKFSIATGAQVGPEFRVNDAASVPYEQRISKPGGIGQAQEESNRSVVIDHDGDFAVVWTTYGLDDPNDPVSGGVYVRLYDRDNKTILVDGKSEILVNQNVTGHQRNASIAMDADGDFVVVWESEGTSFDGSWDVYARRFDAMGRALGDEFRVNSTTPENQLNPSVAMDDRGNFVVAWATSGQDFSFFNDVYAQRYDRFGVPQGAEFRVNLNDLPGAFPLPPSRFEINPTVAMAGPSGRFAIAWEVVVAQQNGVATDTVIAGRTFAADGGNASAEIRLDTNVGSGGGDQFRVARNPQMVYSDQNELMIVWEAYSGNAQDGYDVFYREFTDTMAQQATGRVNLPLFTGHQVNPSIAVDADGDFAIVWDGNGGTVDPLYPNNPDLQVDHDDLGVFILKYNAANQTVMTQQRVNRTEAGRQYQPTIGMEPDGDAIVVWSGVGVGDNHGIFARRYNEPTDTAGPTVSDWADERGTSLDNGHAFEQPENNQTAYVDAVKYLVLTFDEDMMKTGDDSVINAANYALSRNGINVSDQIVRVRYGLNLASQLSGTLDSDANATLSYENTGRVALSASGGTGVSSINVARKNAVIRAQDTTKTLRSGAALPWGQALELTFQDKFASQLSNVTVKLTNPALPGITWESPLSAWTNTGTTYRSPVIPAFVGKDVEGTWVLEVKNNTAQANELTKWELEAETKNRFDFNANPSNKYEAIITFDGNRDTGGRAVSPSFEPSSTDALLLDPLINADYTVQALQPISGFRSGLRDMAGNAIYRTGLTPSGYAFAADFTVQLGGAPETEEPDPLTPDDKSVNPLDMDSILVTQEDLKKQYTTPGQSLAVDGDGDFVVVWTQYDAMANGTPTDANVYARYFTDEVQRLSLSEVGEPLFDLDAGKTSLIEIAYNASVIQQLTVTGGVEPFLGQGDTPDDIACDISLDLIRYDNTLQRYVKTGYTARFTFVESAMAANAAAMTAAFNSAIRTYLGEATGDYVTVRSVNPRDYLIEFDTSTAEQDVLKFRAADKDAVSQVTSGYLPGFVVQTLREKEIRVGQTLIEISQDDPWRTAQNIENAFRNDQYVTSIGPFESLPLVHLTTDVDDPPYEKPSARKTGLEVDVKPVVLPDGTLSLTDFDITFVGSAGKLDHPELKIRGFVRAGGGEPEQVLNERSTTTRKQSSNAFRVNPAEADALDQKNPAVAMDADGDFVIVWESAVSNSQNFGSISDIFAQRFSPFGLLPDGTSPAIQGEVVDIFGGSTGIRALVNPQAEDLQRLTFKAPTGSNTLNGTFRLKYGDRVTSTISFDSSKLQVTANDIAAKLADIGLNGVSVVVVSTAASGQYRFDIRFGGQSAGVDHPTVEPVSTTFPAGATAVAADLPVDFYLMNINQDTANPQFHPAVAMDEVGNFVVAWANGGQMLSYFNHISVQRFNRYGERIGSEFQVNNETTDIQVEPFVALSNRGDFLISWTSTSSATNNVNNIDPRLSRVRAKAFDSTGNVLVNEYVVGTGAFSAAAFDHDEENYNYVITWHGLFDADSGGQSMGVHAVEYELLNGAGQGNLTPVVRRAEFRVNSSSANLADPTLWPFDQAYGQPVLDADGDLTIIYQGFGPDVSVDVGMVARYFYALMEENADLKKYFNPSKDTQDQSTKEAYLHGTEEGVPVDMSSILPLFFGYDAARPNASGDVDNVINQLLYRAQNDGASDAELGRLRAILEQTVGQLRGEANGILVTTWDTDPQWNTLTLPMTSDSVVNSYRDGQNQRYYVEIPIQFLSDGRWHQGEDGTFSLQITNLLNRNLTQTVTVPVAPGGTGWGWPLDYQATGANLETALEQQLTALLGIAWPGVDNGGIVNVREVTPQEIQARIGTNWEIEGVDLADYTARAGGYAGNPGYRAALYEITFQGSAHDTPFEVIRGASNLLRGSQTVDINGNPVFLPIAAPPVTDNDVIAGDTYGYWGTQQASASIGMEPDGDYVTVYTQYERFLSDRFVTDRDANNKPSEYIANQSIYYRRFDEKTDTAGPRVTDWADEEGPLEPDAVIQKNLQYVVLSFNEDMLSGDPARNPDSVLNTANFALFESGTELPGAISRVVYGLSKVAELKNAKDAGGNPLYPEFSNFNPIPSNKWEAVVVFDGDPTTPNADPLPDGFYTFQAYAAVASSSTGAGHTGLRDRAGNTLYHTGYNKPGSDFVRSFRIKVAESNEVPVDDETDQTTVKEFLNGRTHPESPGAIASDADGNSVVVFTATKDGRDRVFYKLFNSEGEPLLVPVVDPITGQTNPNVPPRPFPTIEVTPSGLAQFNSFASDTQSHATVAMDGDGDFVVTWTNQRSGNADIYARRLDSMGEIVGVAVEIVIVNGKPVEVVTPVFKGGVNPNVTGAFRVNSYTAHSQRWSDVAMDVDGDFIITWSSYGQEDNGQLGTGYGVYARRYDSFGQPLGGEFQVNVTKAGDQRFSSVAMDSLGGFTIAWTSNQNGISDDIIVRDFNADGTPAGGPLGGEIVANQTLLGDQRYPDIAMNLAGDQYVVTWSASGQDGSGWGVYGRLFNRSNTTLFVPSSPALAIPDTGTVVARMNVTNNAIITDLNVQLQLRHASPSDLTVELISPTGTTVQLFANVPVPFLNGNMPQGSDFSGTIFDDAAAVAINNPNAGAVPPFAGTFQPMQALAQFNNQNVNGVWTLRITDSNGNARAGLLEQWSLIVERSPVTGQEFRVNTTSVGNQAYSSVAMDHQGEFVVTWSGFGNQPEHQDLSGSGVFVQRFAATGNRIGDESRVNMTTAGDQKFPSVASDGVGNYAIAFTGPIFDANNNPTDETTVYVSASRRRLVLVDNDPPIVTDVQLADGRRLLQGEVIDPATNKLVVMFGEAMSLTGMTSVRSVSNWSLQHNGNERAGAIKSIDFARNAKTQKYEAVLTLDPSVLPLAAGQYVLTASSVIADATGNSLDGDLDGIPGSNPTTTTQPGYQFSFNVSNTSSGAGVGAEYRVNTVTVYQDEFSSAQGTGTAREISSTTLAVDHDGDYAVVWTRYGADDPLDPTGAGVYLRLFDRNDKALTGEILVNTVTSGNQRNPAVAIDADGDLVVVWESEAASVDGSYDVFARRFSSVGVPRDSVEFRVNTDTQQDQVNPAVAMDNSGNFVVVWATKGKNAGFSNDVHGQIYNKEGEPQGFEFLVNGQNLTGINPPADGSFEINPAVGMSGATGNFVVAWEVVTAQQNGVVIDTVLAARQFTFQGAPLAAEFAADTGAGTGGSDTQRVARNPQVAVDDRDGFIIVWESYTGADYDVFFQQFDATGAALSDGQVNMPQFAGQQVNPSVSVDADGDFSIVFNGAGARPDPLNPADPTLYTNVDSEGVWLRDYNSTAIPMSVQSRVNITTGGIQQFPTIGMEPDGDYVVAWSGRGVGDHYGIFVRRYDSKVDLAGPIVSDLVSPSGKSISDGDQVTDELTRLVIVFDEEMMTTGPNSVTNPANYRLVRNGSLLSNVITSIQFGLNPATNKWEAVLTLDGNGSASGVVPLDDGQYQLTVLNSVRDKVGNPLGATGLNPKGNSISWTFNLLGISSGLNQGESLISQGLGGEFTRPYATQAVASDADGDTVTVWTSKTAGQQGIYARLTQTTWTASGNKRVPTTVELPVILVTQNPTADFASVAMDGDGDFVVTWSQESATTSWDVYARRYDSMGNPLGDAFMVNEETDDVQRYSSVAMDVDGDFVIVWQSADQDGSGYGIYGQRFSAVGNRLGGSYEVQVINFANNPLGTFKLRFEGRTTNAITYAGNLFAIADTVEAQLKAIGADVEVEPIDLQNLGIRFVGENGLRDQQQILVVDAVITGKTGAKITASTRTDGAYGEFRVNDTVENDQVFPCVAMDADGTFIVTWTGFGQDGDAPDQSNIYAKQFVGNDAFLNVDGNLERVPYNFNALSRQNPDSVEIISRDNPDNHLVQTDAGYDGVVQLITPTGALGTGSLLYTGRHILTAAHVVEDLLTGGAVPFVDIGFDLPLSGRVTMTATDIYIHPDWNGDAFAGNDIAIIVLPEFAPEAADRYDIYRGSNELGKEAVYVGYGNIGIGFEDLALFDGLKRIGHNTFDAYGEALNGLSTADFYIPGATFDIPAGKMLLFDFDNGTVANDALGKAIGRWHQGLGIREATTASGDSGGPSFLNGVIVGVNSAGVEYIPADSDAIQNRSYGKVGFQTRASAFADWIDQIAQSTSPEFLVNTNVVDPLTGAILVDNQAFDQRWSSVALDADGDFVITWTNYAPSSGTGSGIGGQDPDGVYARRFDSGTNPVSEVFQVNVTATGEQQFSRVAMDADGDFVITWESVTPAGFDIYAQRYVRNAALTQTGSTAYGANGAIGGQFVVNSTRAGDQRYPGIAMNDTGDYLIVWSGSGNQPGHISTQAVFGQRFLKADDDAGPAVTDSLVALRSNGVASMARLIDGDTFEESVTAIVLTFGEDLNVLGGDAGRESVLNLNNWQLTRYRSASEGTQLVAGGITQVQFFLDPSTNKYQAVIFVDDDPALAGNQPLARGTYVLTARDMIEDLFDNRLDGNYDGAPGAPFSISFTVDSADAPLPYPGTPGEDDEDALVHNVSNLDQFEPAVARAADGRYVVVWTSLNDPALDEDGDPIEDLTGTPIVYTNIYARMFDRYGEPTSGEILVSTYTAGPQSRPDVAIDDYGNFVVVWEGEGQGTDKKLDQTGIFARIFDAHGQGSGDQIMVNVNRDGVQTQPAVAMNAMGQFVVTWRSHDHGGIIARQFTLDGTGGAELRVNTTTGNTHQFPDVAMNNDGSFAVTWTAAEQDNGSMGVYAQRFNAAGAKLGGEFRVNQYQTDRQEMSRIAMDDTGNFVIAWQSMGQDAFGGYGVYARRFNAAGTALSNEFRVNDFTAGYQFEPAVSMAPNGDFVVTWSSFKQEGDKGELYGIFAKMYNADGTLFVLPGQTVPVGEYRVNADIEGDQRNSDVSMDAGGHYAIVWQGKTVGLIPDPTDPDTLITGEQIDVYARVVDPPIATAEDPTTLNLFGTPGIDTFEFVAGASPSAWVVKINGVAQTVASTVKTINFNGMGGNDIAVLTGTNGAEKVYAKPGEVEFIGSNFTVKATNVENVTVDGKGGADYAELRDSAGNDSLIMRVGETTMVGIGYSNKVLNFEEVHGYALNGGFDEAKLYDSDGMDRFVGTPTYARMFGDGYMHRAKGFRFVHGYSTKGNDRAELHDGAGNDLFKYDAGLAKLWGSGFYLRAKNFNKVEAVADGGGNDYARIFDTKSVDKFVGTPTSARMYSTEANYDVTARLFEKVLAQSTAGGKDIARFYDSANKEVFTGYSHKAEFSGNRFEITARKFEKVEAYSTPGSNDIAKFRDTAGNDHLVVTADNSASMYTKKGEELELLYQAFAFDLVKTYRSSGSDTKDVAASVVDKVLLDNGWVDD